MHELTGNTVGSLKKMWPPVKRKAMDQHGSFAKYLGQTGTVAAAPAAAPKAAAGKKRKAASEDEAGEDNANSKGDSTEPNTATDKSDDNRSKAKKRGPPKEKKVPVAKKAAGRPRKQVKKEDVDDEAMADPEDNSADGGDGVDKEAEAEVEEEV
ncbi:hypothetical protein NX059_010371 [Plenodomus lindquistii]|nr:hypothetical protein NX059_010371 [Plenodomus lindquistii]